MTRMIAIALCLAVLATPCILDLASREPSPLAVAAGLVAPG